MTNLVVPNGFELVSFFSFDEFTVRIRGVSNVPVDVPALFAADHSTRCALLLDHAATDEDVERWDGLS